MTLGSLTHPRIASVMPYENRRIPLMRHEDSGWPWQHKRFVCKLPTDIVPHLQEQESKQSLITNTQVFTHSSYTDPR